MQDSTKNFSPAIFGVILICFILPFIRVSCAGMECMTFNGINLVTGTTINYPTMFGAMQTQKIGGEPLALIVLLCAISGLVLSFIKSKKGIISAAISAVIGLLSLFSLKSKISNDILREGQGAFFVEYLIGYQALVLCFLLAIGLNIYLFLKNKMMQKAEESQIEIISCKTDVTDKNEEKESRL